MLKTCIWLDKLEINKEPLAFFKGQKDLAIKENSSNIQKARGRVRQRGPWPASGEVKGICMPC